MSSPRQTEHTRRKLNCDRANSRAKLEWSACSLFCQKWKTRHIPSGRPIPLLGLILLSISIHAVSSSIKFTIASIKHGSFRVQSQLQSATRWAISMEAVSSVNVVCRVGSLCSCAAERMKGKRPARGRALLPSDCKTRMLACMRSDLVLKTRYQAPLGDALLRSSALLLVLVFPVATFFELRLFGGSVQRRH